MVFIHAPLLPQVTFYFGFFFKFCLKTVNFNTSSPSRLGDRARRSPRKLPTAMKEEKKRWAMPKFLPHKYDVKLINEDKVCFFYFKNI